MQPDEMECPYCAEVIKAKATICRYCNRPLGSQTAASQQPIAVQIPPTQQSVNITVGVPPSNAPNAKPYPDLSDKWVWTMACVPVLSLILAGLLGKAAVSSADVEVFKLAKLVIILLVNVALLAFDIKELKQKGLTPGSWIWLGLVLIPVYLFLRAAKTNKQYGYAILWCCLFFVSILLRGL